MQQATLTAMLCSISQAVAPKLPPRHGIGLHTPASRRKGSRAAVGSNANGDSLALVLPRGWCWTASSHLCKSLRQGLANHKGPSFIQITRPQGKVKAAQTWPVKDSNSLNAIPSLPVNSGIHDGKRQLKGVASWGGAGLSPSRPGSPSQNRNLW